MATRQHFYAQALGSGSTTNDGSNPGLQVSLAWQPDANSDYFVFCFSGVQQFQHDNDHVGHVELYDVTPAVALANQAVQTKELSSPLDWYPFVTMAKLSYGSSPAAQDLRIFSIRRTPATRHSAAMAASA